MLRSSLSAGISASLVSATPGHGHVFGELIVSPITETLPAVFLRPLTEAFLALRALEESRADQTEHKGAAKHQGRLPAGEVLEIVAHGSRVLAPQIIGYLLDLASHGLRQSGDPLLIFGPEMLGRTPESIGDGAELIGELALALSQAGACPVARLLQGRARLTDYLILHLTDLFPGTAAPSLCSERRLLASALLATA
jgi:hypothetical protein